MEGDGYLFVQQTAAVLAGGKAALRIGWQQRSGGADRRGTDVPTSVSDGKLLYVLDSLIRVPAAKAMGHPTLKETRNTTLGSI